MPSPEARAAFDEAQQFAAGMRELHAQERAVERVKDQTTDPDTIAVLDRELVSLRNEWARLASQYTEAVGRFNQAIEASRRAARLDG